MIGKSITPADEKTDLRRGIDHIGVSVCAIIHDGQGRILLQKRSKLARDEHGHWDLTGGAIEFGEEIIAALERELDEELKTKPLEIKYLTTYDAHRKAADGSPTHWIAIVHAVRVDPAKITIGEPHKVDEIGWFTADTLPSPLHSQFWKSFQVALDHGIIR